MEYYINYNTGAGDETISGTLKDAMKAADEGAAYTQVDITIEDNNGNVIAVRSWWGTAYDPDEADYSEDEAICFGSFGHYGAWAEI
jgi:hypothetical protein